MPRHCSLFAFDPDDDESSSQEELMVPEGTTMQLNKLCWSLHVSPAGCCIGGDGELIPRPASGELQSFRRDGEGKGGGAHQGTPPPLSAAEERSGNSFPPLVSLSSTCWTHLSPSDGESLYYHSLWWHGLCLWMVGSQHMRNLQTPPNTSPGNIWGVWGRVCVRQRGFRVNASARVRVRVWGMHHGNQASSQE